MRILISKGVGVIITNTLLYSSQNKKNETIYGTHQLDIEDQSLEKLITWQKNNLNFY